jgi:DNA-binding MarR family transcriptional regulator
MSRMTPMADQDPSPTKADLCIGAAVRKAARRITQFYDDALRPSGLRLTQYGLLAEIDRHGKAPPTLAELARVMVLDRSALGHNLRPLERDGLIALLEGQEDRRERRIVLTWQGKAKLREAKAFWQLAQDRFSELFGSEQAGALRTVLNDIARDERLIFED